jgi:ABC-type transporter lipoprotein component MlaA
METYIVIILTVIIFIISAVGKNNRKIILQQQNDEPYEPYNNRETTEEPVAYQSIYKPVDNSIEYKESIKAPEEKTFYRFTPNEEGGSISRNSILKNELNLKKTNKDIKDRKFSLKKAVIYSEILNRKYI